MQSIVDKIEDLRNLMHKVAEKKGVSHPEVLTISQKLDVLLNRLLREQVNKNFR